MEKEFIDLGLPSGNLWATENEVGENGQPLYATYDEAVKQFGENLPTRDDWQELLDNVPHLWDKERNGLLFVARNGKELFLSAQGLLGCYWSATAYDLYDAYGLLFSSNEAFTDYFYRDYERAVRLVQERR